MIVFWSKLTTDQKIAVAGILVMLFVALVWPAFRNFLLWILRLVWRGLLFLLRAIHLAKTPAKEVITSSDWWWDESVEALVERLPIGSGLGAQIPYQPRGSEGYWSLQPLLDSRKKQVLFVGTPAVGKTTEAVELVRRLFKGAANPIVFHSSYGFDVPHDDEQQSFPSLRQRRVVVFIDEISDIVRPRATERRQRQAELRSRASEFRRRLRETVAWFQQQSDDLWVIASARKDAEIFEALGLGQRRDRLWMAFVVVTVKDLQQESARHFVRTVCQLLGNIQLDNAAINHLVQEFDGTFASLRDYVIVRSKQIPQDKQVVLKAADVQDFTGTFPADWEKNIYERQIRPSRPLHDVYAALATLSEAQIVPYRFLVEDLATRFLGRPFIFNHWRARQALQKLFGHRPPSGIQFVNEAYLRGKSALSAQRDKVWDTLEKASKSHPFLGVATARFADGSNEPAERERAICGIRRCIKRNPRSAALWGAQAVLLHRAGKLDEAIHAAMKAAQFGFESPAPHQTLASLLEARDRFEEALEEALAAVHFAPHRSSCWNTVAVVFNKLKEMELAYGVALAGLRVDPHDASLLETLARILEKRGKPSSALRVVNRAMRLSPEQENVYSTKALILEKLKDWEGLCNLCETASNAGVDSADLRATYINALDRHSKDDDLVWSACQKALKDFADLDEIRRCVAWVLSHRGRYPLVIELLLAIHPSRKHVQDWRGLAYAYSFEKDYKEVVHAMSQVPDVERNQQDWRVLAYAYSFEKDYKKVVDAMSHVPDAERIQQDWHVLGYDYSHQKNYREVITALCHVPEEERSRQDWLNLAFAYDELQCHDQALIAFERARERGDFVEPKVLSTYGLVLTEFRDESAVSWCQKAVSATKDRPKQEQALWLLNLGVAIRKTKSAREAIPICEQAVDLNPLNPSAHYASARAYEEDGQPEKARAALRKALDLSPGYNKARQKLTEIESRGR